MSRPYPNSRRRRPGRRPPDRYKGGVAPHTTRHGFTGSGLSAVYNMFLPLRGREKRAYFNRMAAILALSAGYGGALLGYGWFGLIGAVLGFLCGLCADCSFLERQRFFRG